MPSSLLIQTSFLGDVVLSTPLIAELAKRGPVDVIVTPSGGALLANNPYVARQLVFDKKGSDRGPTGLRRVARSAGAPHADSVAYCAQGSLRSALVALLAGYRHRVGFDTSAGRWLYTHREPYRADRHHAERLLRLAIGDDATVTPELLRPALFPGEKERLAVRDVLAGAGHSGEPLIALAPGSVWATKRWPYFPALARQLTEQGRVVVIGSESDAPIAHEIVTATDGTAIDATGRLSLLASAELLSRCILLVTNDSAPQHLASAVGTPTVTIFGPTVPAFGFGPLAPHSRVVGHPSLDCRPCHPHGPRACPLGHWRCMRELDASRVLEAVTEGLQATRA